MSGMYKVVIVEDEEFLLRGLVVATDWSAMDCIIVGEAENAFRGEVIIRHLMPDIVITDVRMPMKSGLEMIKGLQDLEGIEYIILSGYADFQFAQQAIELDVRRYLLKPIEDNALSEAIENAKYVINERRLHFQQSTVGLENNDTAKILPFGDYRDEYIQETIRYIDTHFIDTLKIKDMAANLGISESTLSKLFKNRTGYSIVEYVVRNRMRHALELLQERNTSINEVAEAVGYKDYRYFCELFKKHFHITPYEFKKGAMPKL
jgi:two-component system response regulator YesN